MFLDMLNKVAVNDPTIMGALEEYLEQLDDRDRSLLENRLVQENFRSTMAQAISEMSVLMSVAAVGDDDMFSVVRGLVGLLASNDEPEIRTLRRYYIEQMARGDAIAAAFNDSVDARQFQGRIADLRAGLVDHLH